MKLFSGKGEFAFVSFGGTAHGIIAIGGVAYGVVAIGAFLSLGVISIGMNAVGSVVALGMNAVGPISLSLINGLGLYTRAGVNGAGAWTTAGTNSTGIASDGGVNTGNSIVPAVIVIAALLIASTVLPGRRARRRKGDTSTLRMFLSSPEVEAAKVRARLRGVQDDVVQLSDGAKSAEFQSNAETRELAESFSSTQLVHVIAELVRVEETEPVSQEVSYRERPPSAKTVVIRCVGLAPAPEPESWLPKDLGEIQWIIAWSARIAVAVAVALLIWRAVG